MEGGKQLPGAQRAVGRCLLSFPLPSTPLLRPSGPATHPELRILGSHTHTPWASFPILWARFFQVAAQSLATLTDPRLSLLQVLWPSGLRGRVLVEGKVSPGSGSSSHWICLLSCPYYPL